MRLFKGDVAVVTGAGRGAGQAIACGLARMGAAVVLTDLREAEVAETARTLASEGFRAWSHALDVTDTAQVAEVAARVMHEAGDVSILVNNAGVCLRAPFDDNAAFHDVWRTTMDVNVQGIINLSLAFHASLRKTRGRVVNMASIASFVATTNNPAYPVSKAAVSMLTKSMAQQWASDGIRVNAIAPSLIETPMADGIRQVPGRMEELLRRVPLGRVAAAEEMVGPVAFLASDLSSYVTGITMPVDGGFLAI